MKKSKWVSEKDEPRMDGVMCGKEEQIKLIEDRFAHVLPLNFYVADTIRKSSSQLADRKRDRNTVLLLCCFPTRINVS